MARPRAIGLPGIIADAGALELGVAVVLWILLRKARTKSRSATAIEPPQDLGMWLRYQRPVSSSTSRTIRMIAAGDQLP